MGSQPAKTKRFGHSAAARRRSLRVVEGPKSINLAPQLNPLIHERVRLGVLSALASANVLSFTDLRKLLGVSDGNLSVHARKLEQAGFIRASKSFVKRVPKTEYRLCAAGRRALEEYLDHMEALIRNARKG